jgi:hypothetical protein
MELDSYKSPVWQLGANIERTGETERFHYSTRYHLFVDGRSKCNEYEQDTLEHENVVGKVERLAKLPDLLACKKCWRAWQKKYAVSLANSVVQSDDVSTQKEDDTMKLIYDRADRKRMVQLIAEITGCDAKYMGAPTFAYQVDSITIDRDGTLHIDDMADSDMVQNIVKDLKLNGYECISCTYDDPQPEPEEIEVPCEDCPPPYGTAEDDGKGLAIQMPMLTDAELANLHALLTAKGALIKKALGVSELSVKNIDGRLDFSWFSEESTPEEIQAYMNFVTALYKMAKNQKRISAKEKVVDNEKYAFRCFLLRLGFIGEEYKVDRKILLRNLTGSAAFKSGQKKEVAICE